MPFQRKTSSKASSTLLVRSYSKPLPLKPLLCYAPSDPALLIPSPRIPPELIDFIVELALCSSINSHIPNFSAIAALTLASSHFRQIAMRRFFREIFPISKLHWTALYQLLSAQETRFGRHERAYNWTKVLCSSSRVLLDNPKRLSFLTHLRELSIDFAKEGLTTQHPSIKNLFQNLTSSDVMVNMKSLTLSSLPRIDTFLLQLIATTFPGLMHLDLSCTERLEFGCCWSCFEDSLTCTAHSPVPNDYSSCEDLAHAFADSLRPLRNLVHLHLGIFLSHDQLLYEHMAHSQGQFQGPGSIDDAPQCRECFHQAVDNTRIRELAASLVMAQKLKRLQLIGWNSLFCRDIDSTVGETQKPDLELVMSETSDEDNDNDRDSLIKSGQEAEGTTMLFSDMRVRMWVLRNKGRVKVRRKPLAVSS